MTFLHKAAGGALAALAVIGTASLASAKPASCFSSDEGHYECNFVATDNQGSFEASAPGYPTTLLNVESPGVAWVFKDFGGGKNTALPGPYYRAEDDRACWDNPDTGDRFCAW
ncbi:MAG: hypothetical protein AB7F51_13475 [Pseudorhodoplanes sp.]